MSKAKKTTNTKKSSALKMPGVKEVLVPVAADGSQRVALSPTPGLAVVVLDDPVTPIPDFLTGIHIIHMDSGKSVVRYLPHDGPEDVCKAILLAELAATILDWTLPAPEIVRESCGGNLIADDLRHIIRKTFGDRVEVYPPYTGVVKPQHKEA